MMNSDLDQGGLQSEKSTIGEDSRLPKRTEECESHSFDHIDVSILISEASFLDLNSHTVEVRSSEQCGHVVGQSMCSSVIPRDAVSVMKDETEWSDSEAGNASDVVVMQHIDSVFIACDPTGTGTVAVNDVIAYLRDTLHVSNFLLFAVTVGRKLSRPPTCCLVT